MAEEKGLDEIFNEFTEDETEKKPSTEKKEKPKESEEPVKGETAEPTKETKTEEKVKTPEKVEEPPEKVYSKPDGTVTATSPDGTEETTPASKKTVDAVKELRGKKEEPLKEEKTGEKPSDKSEKEIETISKDDVGDMSDIMDETPLPTETEEKSAEKEEPDLFAEKSDEDKSKEEKSTETTPPPEKKEESPKKSDDVFEAKKEKTDFDYSQAEENYRINIVIHANKGDGKTSLAFAVPGNHNCMSFDGKSKVIQEEADDKDRIKVYNGVRYLNKSSAEIYIESAHDSWRYLRGLIGTWDMSDWTVIDGGEIFEAIAEQVMRYNQGLTPFQGIANRNIWKERKLILSQFYKMCGDKAKNGVIWTTYVNKDQIVEEGEFVAIKDVPRWIDAVLYETDVVIRVETKKDKGGKVEYFATVESSKVPDKVMKKIFGGVFKKGIRLDITDRGFDALIQK